MPSGFTADEHSVRIFTDGGVNRLRCRCGWALVMADEELWVEGEPWREVAQAHVESFPTTDPACQDRSGGVSA